MKKLIFALTALSLSGSQFAMAQFGGFGKKNFQYQNQFSTGQEAAQAFGLPPSHTRNDPGINAGEFKFELGSKLECGNIDINANIKGQFNELQKQLKDMVPQNAAEARRFLTASAFTTICYAYPTVCAQLRHDWLSIQGKLNLRAQACAAVDKFIDNQAEKGSRQLKSEAQAACVQKESSRNGGDVAAALSSCQGKTGLALRDFQTGMMREFHGAKQKVLKSMLVFSKDETAYDFLTTFLGEIQVNGDGQWEPLFEKGLLRPADVADAFLTKGQELSCNNLTDVLQNRYVTSNVYDTEVASVIKRKLGPEAGRDLDALSRPDRQLACLALGRAVGREAAQRAASHYESAVTTGLLNTAIPEALRNEYRERSLSAFPALRAAIESESIPPVEAVRQDLATFANLQRRKTALLAGAANRGTLQNKIEERNSASDCSDSLTCR